MHVGTTISIGITAHVITASNGYCSDCGYAEPNEETYAEKYSINLSVSAENAAAGVSLDNFLTKIGEKEYASVTAGEIKVIFDKAAITVIKSANNVVLSLKTVDSTLENAVLTIEVNMNAVFSSGRATLKLKVPTLPDGNRLVVYYVNGSDTTDMKGEYIDGYAAFTTNHFSTYAVLFVANAKTSLSGGAIAGIVIGVVVFLLIVAFGVLFFLNKKGIVNIALFDKLFRGKEEGNSSNSVENENANNSIENKTVQEKPADEMKYVPADNSNLVLENNTATSSTEAANVDEVKESGDISSSEIDSGDNSNSSTEEIDNLSSFKTNNEDNSNALIEETDDFSSLNDVEDGNNSKSSTQENDDLSSSKTNNGDSSNSSIDDSNKSKTSSVCEESITADTGDVSAITPKSNESELQNDASVEDSSKQAEKPAEKTKIAKSEEIDIRRPSQTQNALRQRHNLSRRIRTKEKRHIRS